jgi:hypothetical protein
LIWQVISATCQLINAKDSLCHYLPLRLSITLLELLAFSKSIIY